MNYLILHRIPYHYFHYAEIIDHDRNNVVYIGVADSLKNIPEKINCLRIARPGLDDAHCEASEILDKLKIKFDVVISMSEYELMDAAIIRQKFSIQGALPEQVKKVRNKVLMKHLVSDAGLKSPRYVRFDEFRDSLDHVRKWQSDLIFKPVDGASSENVLRFSSADELIKKFSEQNFLINEQPIDKLDLTQFEVEEYVDGEVMHFDGLCSDGKIRVVTCCKYINSCLDYSNGLPVASVQIDINESDLQWLNSALNAVGIERGAFHLEAIRTKNGLCFLEVANRCGGGMVIEAFELQTGIHLPSLELELYSNPSIEVDPRIDNNVKYAFFLFPGHKLDSDFCRVSGHEFLRTLNELVKLYELNEGTPVKKRQSYEAVDVPLAGMLKSSCSKELEEIVSRVFSEVSIVERNQKYAG